MMGRHSTDQLHRRPELREFVAIVHDNIAEVARSNRIHTNQASLELATCWAIVNGKTASGAVQCHPNSFLSGLNGHQIRKLSSGSVAQDRRSRRIRCPIIAAES